MSTVQNSKDPLGVKFGDQVLTEHPGPGGHFEPRALSPEGIFYHRGSGARTAEK